MTNGLFFVIFFSSSESELELDSESELLSSLELLLSDDDDDSLDDELKMMCFGPSLKLLKSNFIKKTKNIWQTYSFLSA